ncbi:maleylpyruvate isomerase family mycothiol-dependent enzyme [Nostocoides sp. F2B08]|uniref:maleylpyruvate isomerase family mycothiol-dependent enzyme n=1 Tax=Nostocoides sp. F2B08 TaxID=2653936 RepID=UPI001262CC89|nr:maleylpyruvate isomerase family mycothiol-dependent enzyme [Tetrasphaera sp. F2B08]KAB7744110.1 maleylpyruvate isomerase family mycothiol-dependent enzyme [Tetrasphaera sp. F2B08]
MTTSALPRMSTEQARLLALTEYARFTDLLRALDPQDWTRPTDCDRWDVRAVADHVAGAAKMYASVTRTLAAQLNGWLVARRLGLGEPLDGVNELQIRETADLPVPQLISFIEEWAPRVVEARFSVPRPMRRIPAKGMGMTMPLVDLYAYVLTRDVWMHRVDISRATGRDLVLTSDHDGALVADVVAEWAGRHGRPFELELTGPAGGAFGVGPAFGERIELDAVEFCRTISGRSVGSGLLAEPAMF